MKKRTVILGDYDTAAHGLWTLNSLDFAEPTQETNLVEVPGRTQGPLDLSTVLTDGEPVYGSRSLNITLESSEGDRAARAGRIAYMTNKLHGRRVNIVLPDYPMYYATGRLSVKTAYNDLAHASVEINGTCEPWLYAAEETEVQLHATATTQSVRLRNAGAMPVVPVLEVSADEGESVLLVYGSASHAMSSGTYIWPTLLLTPGDHIIAYSGAGTLTITYREAILR